MSNTNYIYGDLQAAYSGGTIYSGGTDLYDIFALNSQSGGTSGDLWSASTGSNSIIANNGTGNLAAGTRSVVLAGFNNHATQQGATVVAGTNNTANWANTLVVGGFNNTASYYYSTIVGGALNTASNYYSTVISGINNKASGFNSFIAGGASNSATTNTASVIAGTRNLASGLNSSILGGSGNTVNGNLSVIVGGSGLTNTYDETLMVKNLRAAENGGVIYSGGTDLYDIFGFGATGQSLSQVLTNGNTTGANDISINSGQKILFQGGGQIFEDGAPYLTFLSQEERHIFTAPNGYGGGGTTPQVHINTDGVIRYYSDNIGSTGLTVGSLEMQGITVDRTWVMPDASGTVALVSDITGYSGNTLSEVLANGNTTGANDISIDNSRRIIPSNGTGYIDLRFGTDERFAIINNGNWEKGLMYMDSTDSYFGWNWETNFLNGLIAGSGTTRGDKAQIVVGQRSVFYAQNGGTQDFWFTPSTDSGPSPSVIIASGVGSRMATGITNSAIVAGDGVTATTSNTLYTQNFDATAITADTVHADQFFSMAPYTDSSPASPSDNDVWFHSGATGSITLNYRIGGATYNVELSV